MEPMLVSDSERIMRYERWREAFGMDESIQAGVVRLTSDVQHIQTDVADIKVQLGRVDDRLDAMNERFDRFRNEIGARIDRGDEKVDGRVTQITADLGARIDGLGEKLEKLRDEMTSMKVWALCLYFGLAGSMLLVMAKGFKWI